ncbi:excinuclease ABC subunit UvrC [Candidatus Methylacidithermus pantelleriae]|uniref:Nuclease subunit of the excinuclease complex n=1 Tax=Candidatus Methylacidithermus pantelleriae TaxID=2744239 RepID=A0A8J2BQL9_9BACT|nr:excinuclease ABC subunit UvrC [Candidatus Methylacidithermus pantelleriae]CAF0699144.1 Nuclease subunit of the excinuclease complex [Candidatus Methylacidithermus pantelleriae]
MEAEQKKALQQKILELPHKPGVYLFKDRFDRVIYVGKARDLHRRVHSYFHPSRKIRSDPKMRALLEAVYDMDIQVVRSEAEAVLLEGRLIKEYRPRYNVSFRDDKRFLLVKVNLNEPFPRFQLTRLRKEDGCRYFGPFASSGALRKTVNLMNKLFQLRSCSPMVPTEKDYKHCLDHIIKNCSAPCLGKVDSESYRRRVLQACEFLEGKAREWIMEMEKQMQAAAEALDFEKAARLRDLLEDLRRTTTPARRFARSLPALPTPQEDLQMLASVLGLPEPPRRIECFDISNISQTHKVASMVLFQDAKPNRSAYRRYRIRTVEGQDDFACMAEVVRRRYRRLLEEGGGKPDLIMVDGGLGQLHAARKELEALGLAEIPVIALAKENEEIYRLGCSEPLVLDPSSGALRLLQRVRDEAHRFAHSYHELLFRQRITESILDECPGIDRYRKSLLLRTFGSIERLRQASLEELKAVKGIGPKLAQRVYEFLSSRREDVNGSP